MASRIPDEWKRKVRDALDSHELSRIRIRKRAQTDWDATFPLTFTYELFVAISDALANPSIAGTKKTMDEPTETYAFFFHFQKTKMYTKIGLMPDGTVVIIYSAHRPLKGEHL